MSRGARDDDRETVPQAGWRDIPPARPPADRPQDGAGRHARHRDDGGGRGYRPNASETRTLATVGTFRIMPVEALTSQGRDHRTADNVRRLTQARLLEQRTVVIAGRSRPVVALTRDGKASLERHRARSAQDTRQQYHAGFVKPREMAHDAQLYALYTAEARRVEQAGGRPLRVILDYELKRDYQAYLHRRDRPADESIEDARAAFAGEYGLPIVDGHLELPDLRMEIETADGRLEYRDLELITEHYSRAQLAGKARAGFTAYRAGGRAAGGSTKTGGTPYDPHYLEWLS